jgi:hypothetical protein
VASVRTFDRSMIRNVLDEHNIHFLTDRDNDLQVQYPDDGTRGCDLTYALMYKENVFLITAIGDKEIPRSEWGRAILLCNTWNRDNLWPKACLWAENPDSDANGYIRLEGSLYVASGIHQELLSDFILTIMGNGLTFWEWAHKEQGF